MAAATVSFPSIGTTAQVTVLDPDALGTAVALVEDELAALDLACSRFRDDSELAALNRSAGRPFRAGSLLVDALTAALEAAELTDGDVDPTVGRALDGLGWDRDFAVVVSRGERPSIDVVPAGGWRSVTVDRERGIVRIPPGLTLDLGATAKAFCADRCAARVAAHTGAGTLVSLGGDVSLAGPAPEGGWAIRVTDDHRARDGAPGQTISLASGGLATSSTTVRRWRAGSAERHHIVDPRTGLPAREVWRTVSVAAPSCVAANTATTAAIVRGEAAVGWLEDQGLPARLVSRDGAVATTSWWPEDAR
jgi:thiamine biosynthesis lipoprotein